MNSEHVRELALSVNPLMQRLDQLGSMEYEPSLATEFLSCLKTTNALLGKVVLPHAIKSNVVEQFRLVAVDATKLVQIRSGVLEGNSDALLDSIRMTIRTLLNDVKSSLIAQSPGSHKSRPSRTDPSVPTKRLEARENVDGGVDEEEKRRRLEAMKKKANAAFQAAVESPRSLRRVGLQSSSSSPLPTMTASSRGVSPTTTPTPAATPTPTTASLSGDKVVSINIGGQVFTTMHSTLTQSGRKENFFTSRLANSTLPTDSNGIPFVDRSAVLFEPILHYLRTGVWVCPTSLPERMYLCEALEYGIDVSSLNSPHMNDNHLRLSIRRYRHDQYHAKWESYSELFGRIQSRLFEDWSPLARKGATTLLMSFVPSLTTLRVREKREFSSEESVVDLYRHEVAHAHTLVLDDDLYEALDDAPDALVWGLGEMYNLSVDVETRFEKSVLRKVPFITIRWKGGEEDSGGT